MFDGIGILINIILLIIGFSVFILLAPNLKILKYTIQNTFDFKSSYQKGEFVTFIFFSFFIRLFFYILDIGSIFYFEVFDLGSLLFVLVILFYMISMIIRTFNKPSISPVETELKKSFDFKYIYISLAILFSFTFIYLFSVLPYWEGTYYTVLLTLSIINFGFLLWLFIKIFKSNN